jgi:hypothetical protein
VTATTRIAAPPEVVFPYFTDPALIVTWLGDRADLNAQPGGVFAVEAHPQVEIRLRTFELTHPGAGLLDCSTDVAFVRPPVRAPGIKLASLAEEPRVFVLPADHHLAGRDHPGLSDTAGLPWIGPPRVSWRL